jgi:hypothetical protein
VHGGFLVAPHDAKPHGLSQAPGAHETRRQRGIRDGLAIDLEQHVTGGQPRL